MQPRKSCPDCGEEVETTHVDRRQFIAATAGAAAITVLPKSVFSADTPAKPKTENLVEKLYQSFNDDQRSKLCFPWDHTDKRGLLRTFSTASTTPNGTTA
jgi:hypothetical protein